MDFTQWRMAGKYGYRRDLVLGWIDIVWERIWLCTIRRQHRIKLSSNGTCIRCGRPVT